MKIVKIDEYGITFDNGNYLTAEHEQDCCENVYADFKHIKDYNTLGDTHDKTVMELDFHEDLMAHIELVKDLGFKMQGVLVPCHNEQNGYYSNNLELQYHRKRDGSDVTESMDISKCTKDDIW